MTCIMYGHSKRKHNIGTVYANYTLTSVDTSVNVCGTVTITLPTSPSIGQAITITNTCNGIVTISPIGLTISPGNSVWFIWGGYSWGYVYGIGCSTVVLPVTHDFGVVQYAGPSETPYVVPATTTTYSIIGTNPCGSRLRITSTKTYSQREIAGQFRTSGTWAGYPGGAQGVAPTIGLVANGYGATAIDSQIAHGNNAVSICSSTGIYTLPPIPPGTNYDFWFNPALVTWGAFAYIGIYASAGVGGVVYIYSCYYDHATVGPLSIYYLDVHEVWTYDFI